MISARGVFHSLAALADPLRCRLLLLLERKELTVAELVRALQLPQSSVSRHLKTLSDEGLVSARVSGASNRYSMHPTRLDPPVRRLWNVVREQTGGLPAAAEDARRLSSVLSERRSRSQAYFSSAAGQWDRIRSELFGESTFLRALLALLDPSAVVCDLGCGTAHVAEVCAPHVRRVIAVDDSPAMLSAARRRLAPFRNVDLRRGDVASLPLRDAEADVAVMQLVLSFVEETVTVLREARRVLRPGGRLLVIDMQPHDRAELAHEMGHHWRGLTRKQVRDWSSAAGFEDLRYTAIAPDTAAMGPSLFAAVMRKGSTQSEGESALHNQTEETNQ